MNDSRATTALCNAPHDRPRRALDGLVVCEWHRRTALDATAQLPALHDHLAEWLPAPSSTGPTRGTSDPGLKVNHAVIRTRDNIRRHLRAWIQIALDEGPWRQPPTGDLPALAQWICTRIDWYCAQDWSAEFVTQTLELRREGRSHRQANQARMFDIGKPCPEPDCTGTLVATIRPADDLLPSQVRCDLAPIDEDGNPIHVWPADKWLILGRGVLKREETA
jgi:hypothetical protein